MPCTPSDKEQVLLVSSESYSEWLIPSMPMLHLDCVYRKSIYSLFELAVSAGIGLSLVPSISKAVKFALVALKDHRTPSVHSQWPPALGLFKFQNIPPSNCVISIASFVIDIDFPSPPYYLLLPPPLLPPLPPPLLLFLFLPLCLHLLLFFLLFPLQLFLPLLLFSSLFLLLF